MKRIICTLILMILLTSILLPVKVFAVETSADDIINKGDEFLSKGSEKDLPLSDNAFVELSDSIYSVLLAIGVVVAVVVGTVLGLKFMISTVDEKADIKKALIAYIIGCIVIFGAFTIWKIAVNILSQV